MEKPGIRSPRRAAFNDWTPPEMGNLYGIDAFAINPNNASKLYMVAGANFGTDKPAMLLSSQDQGRNFKQVPLPFSTGANEKGNWAYGQNGVEESAPLSLISPTANEWNAYPLIAGIGDVLPQWGDNLSVSLGKPGEIWLSTFAGLYRNTNWGQGNWSRMPIVESAKGLGFGKAAPGASYPACTSTERLTG
jgi:hypothetical protein